MEHLLAKIDANQERLEAKLWAEIKIIRGKVCYNQEKMDDEQKVEAQMGSPASHIHVNQEGMKSMFDACLKKMVTNLKEKEVVAEQQEVPKMRPR